MPVESVTYISDFVVTNPIGATDPKSQGDDHLRNIKLGIKNTFPNVNGAVNPTPAQFNLLSVSAALSVLANATNAAAAPAALAAGANDRLLRRTGDTLNFGQLTAGMFPNAVVPDAALSSNVPLKNAANTFTAQFIIDFATGIVQTLNDANGVGWQIRPDAGKRGWLSFTEDAVADRWLVGIENGDGTLHFATGNVGAYTKRFGLNSSGEAVTPNASAAEVGFKGTPINDQSGNYTLVLSDAGKCIKENNNGATVTIPANASVAFPVGTVVTIFNNSVGNISIAITTDSLIQAGTSATGTRTVATTGIATVVKVAGATWMISGPGVS